MVGQEPVLFNRSIKDNISYALDENDEDHLKDDSAIIHAAEEANAHGFVTDLVNGYNTMCGQRGGQLSGGQKTTRVHRSSNHSQADDTAARRSHIRPGSCQ